MGVNMRRGDVGSVFTLKRSFIPCFHFFAHSFGHCVNSDVRSDQCQILEPTELLRVIKPYCCMTVM